MNITTMRTLAPAVLRYGLVFVFVWFSVSQLTDPNMWARQIPEWLTNLTGMSAVTIVKLNGTFEIIMAILLAFGIQIRIVAALLTLHMLSIAINLGLGATAVRDIGLMFGCLSVALHGADAYSYDTIEKMTDYSVKV